MAIAWKIPQLTGCFTMLFLVISCFGNLQAFQSLLGIEIAKQSAPHQVCSVLGYFSTYSYQEAEAESSSWTFSYYWRFETFVAVFLIAIAAYLPLLLPAENELEEPAQDLSIGTDESGYFKPHNHKQEMLHSQVEQYMQKTIELEQQLSELDSQTIHLENYFRGRLKLQKKYRLSANVRLVNSQIREAKDWERKYKEIAAEKTPSPEPVETPKTAIPSGFSRKGKVSFAGISSGYGTEIILLTSHD